MKLDIWDRLDLPGEQLPGEVLVEILGKNRVLIEHHRGVREYSTERIGVNVKYGIVHISGTGLRLRCMTDEQLVITGSIDAVELLGRETA